MPARCCTWLPGSQQAPPEYAEVPPSSAVFSTTTVDSPALWARNAPVSAPPPEPTTTTSYSRSSVMTGILEHVLDRWWVPPGPVARHNGPAMTDELQISYPPELPVSQRRDDIAEAIRDHQVVIVAGETGSGKTTQLPKICLELGRGVRGGDGRGDGGGLIGHTQPRRIAARSVAERIASELGTELGDLVGYQVRFTDRTSQASRVKLMTDGILLAELQRDRMLKKYDTIIIDEAHERSLNIDFLLGYLKRLLPRRPDL